VRVRHARPAGAVDPDLRFDRADRAPWRLMVSRSTGGQLAPITLPRISGVPTPLERGEDRIWAVGGNKRTGDEVTP
jgi:hypothetical protein